MRVLSWVLWVVMVVSAVGALSNRPLMGLAVLALISGVIVDKHRLGGAR